MRGPKTSSFYTQSYSKAREEGGRGEGGMDGGRRVKRGRRNG